MAKPILGLDIDDTIISFMDHFLDYLRSRDFVPPCSTKDITGYEIYEWLGVSVKRGQRLLDDFQNDRGMYLYPSPGAQAALVYLSARWDIISITARPFSEQVITRSLIERHFGDIVSKVIHVKLSPELAIPKWQMAYAFGVQVMIDDSLSHVTEAATHGLNAILMDRGFGWNQSKSLPAGVYRVNSWGQAVRYLQHLEHLANSTFRLTAAAAN